MGRGEDRASTRGSVRNPGWVRNRFIRNLLGQYLRRTAGRSAWFRDYERGISLFCPLSPLIGACVGSGD